MKQGQKREKRGFWAKIADFVGRFTGKDLVVSKTSFPEIRCETCFYFYQGPDQQRNDLYEIGECRWPAPVLRPGHPNGSDKWPIVQTCDFCGQWVRRIKDGSYRYRMGESLRHSNAAWFGESGEVGF